MSSGPVDQTGILILRLWVEGSSPGLRARITQKLNTMASEQTVATAATSAEIYSAVQTWVEAFQALNHSRSNGVAHDDN